MGRRCTKHKAIFDLMAVGTMVWVGNREAVPQGSGLDRCIRFVLSPAHRRGGQQEQQHDAYKPTLLRPNSRNATASKIDHVACPLPSAGAIVRAAITSMASAVAPAPPLIRR